LSQPRQPPFLLRVRDWAARLETRMRESCAPVIEVFIGMETLSRPEHGQEIDLGSIAGLAMRMRLSPHIEGANA
jgi:hypothetical protein